MTIDVSLDKDSVEKLRWHLSTYLAEGLRDMHSKDSLEDTLYDLLGEYNDSFLNAGGFE